MILLVQNYELFFMMEIIVLGTIIYLAGRTSDKILRGLQGTAASTIIARGIYDAYNTWKSNGSSSSSDDSGNKHIEKDKVKNPENKTKSVSFVTRINEK